MIYIMNAGYADYVELRANTPTQAESLLYNLMQAVGGIDLHMNADKIECLCFNPKGDISSLNGCSLKLVDKFTFLGISVSSLHQGKAWSAIDRLLII